MNKIFNEGNYHFICMVHIVKMAGKDFAPFHFQGKILPCQEGKLKGQHNYNGLNLVLK